MNDWSEFFREVGVPKSIREEVIEYIVGFDWLDSSEHNVVIVLFFELVLKGFIGLIHLNEFLVSLFIICILLRMILESLLPIRIFYLLKSSSSGNS